MSSRAMSGRGRGTTRAVMLNALVVLMGLLTMVGVFYAAATLGAEKPAQRLAEAFDDGTLSEDVARILEPVPGFIVMESDYEGMCHSYAHALSTREALFGLGMRPAEPIFPLCVSVNATVHGELGQGYSGYYRYWQGAAAFNRIALNVMSVFWWQILLTAVLMILIVALIWRTTKYSRTLALGTAVICLMVVDFPWQGMAPLHGVSSVFGFMFALLTLAAFERQWRARWAVATLGGVTYAMVAHTLVPAAFAMLVSVMAMLPLLRRSAPSGAGAMWVGVASGLLWFIGYGLATAARAVWVIIWGPGYDELVAEWTGTGGGFLTRSLTDPVYQFIGLMGKTWLSVGFMQVGLMLFFAVLGWSLAKGGAPGFRSRLSWIALSPVLLGAGWLTVWAVHTNHTYAHAVPGLMLLTLLFASEAGRVVGSRQYTLVLNGSSRGVE